MKITTAIVREICLQLIVDDKKILTFNRWRAILPTRVGAIARRFIWLELTGQFALKNKRIVLGRNYRK